ncbi:MarR family winged helix-turn-helix transcriptional regulator [Fodinicola feengrottensis]|uniref:MarR family winged helix-turn-helix transcriptional regulator n=1 Tax=Fodinicola feengrottensis TaxID=435914 RepID=UPI0024423E19|nr:MarR family winged helix-turn-helix transcriptional regulator [Fodinicola feengrottensis]
MAVDPLPPRATGRWETTSPFALGLLLRRAHWHAAEVMFEALRPLGIELRHFAVLNVLVDQGPTMQKDLVAATGSDKAGIMRVVDDLEHRRLAVRKLIPGDRRARSVEITPTGLELFPGRPSRRGATGRAPGGRPRPGRCPAADGPADQVRLPRSLTVTSFGCDDAYPQSVSFAIVVNDTIFS